MGPTVRHRHAARGGAGPEAIPSRRRQGRFLAVLIRLRADSRPIQTALIPTNRTRASHKAAAPSPCPGRMAVIGEDQHHAAIGCAAEIDAAARCDAQKVTHRFRDGHLTFRGHGRAHLRLGKDNFRTGITWPCPVQVLSGSPLQLSPASKGRCSRWHEARSQPHIPLTENPHARTHACRRPRPTVRQI